MRKIFLKSSQTYRSKQTKCFKVKVAKQFLATEQTKLKHCLNAN